MRPDRDTTSAVSDADRWVNRALVVLGALGGGAFGFLFAPKLQWDLRHFGVDPIALGPAIAIVVGSAVLGALATWWTGRRRAART